MNTLDEVQNEKNDNSNEFSKLFPITRNISLKDLMLVVNQKYTTAPCQLTYAHECLLNFCKCVIKDYGEKYLRNRTQDDI